MKKESVLILSVLIIILTLIGGVSAENSTNIDITVNYEYDDNINSEISITQNNLPVDYIKQNNDSNNYQISINNATQENNYSISVSAPGYSTEVQNLTSNSLLSNNVIFNLEATDIYKLGYDVTIAADNLLHFSSADDVLVITTAGLTRINDSTTEDALEGIVNAGKNYISYGKGNILTLSAVRTDPTNFAFFIKNGNSLKMAFYKNGSINPIYYGTGGPELTSEQWKKLQNLLGKEDAYSYISIANSWASGISKDVLTQATYHGHVCTGLISGQAMIQTLLTHYPPRGESGLPLENTAYYVLGVPGGSDDDAFTWTMDITPGKRAYIGIDTMVNKTMTGFIRWNSTSNTGILIIMSYNEEKLKSEFKAISGLNPDSSVIADLQYQNWLINKLKNNPTSLVQILYEFKGLTEDNLYYLMGQEIGKGNVTKSAHGLDIDYILNLGLENAIRETKNMIKEVELTEKQLKQIGIDASNMAVNYFKSVGINIEKDYSRLYVLTSAGYVRINGTSTEMIYDGINEVLGSTLSRKTLLPVHTALWKDLVFDFFWVEKNNNKNTSSFSLKYDPTTGKLIVIGNSSESSVNANYILQEVLKYDPPYDSLIAWLFHNHVCGGSSPGYLISDYIYNELPLGENESYIYITTNDNCKDDVISRLLGVSPGMENYYNLRYDNSITKGSDVGIAIKWNSETKTGELIIINWKAPTFAKGSDSYEEYIKLYKKDYSSPNLISQPVILSSAKKPINEEMLNNIVSGATSTTQGNSIDYIRSLPDILPINPSNPANPINPSNPTNNNNGQSNGTYLTNNDGSSSSGAYVSGSQVPSSTVGISPNSLSSAPSQGNGDKPNNGKSYEVSKNPTEQISSNNIIYVIALIVVIGLIAGYGFMKNRKND